MAKKKLEIAFLSFYSGIVSRGVEVYVHELANRLAEMGHSVTVYQNGKKKKDAKYRTVSIGLDYDFNNGIGNRSFFNYSSRKVKEFTQLALKEVDKNTDVIIPTNGRWQSLLSRYWAYRNKAKMVMSGQSGPKFDDIFNLFTFPTRFVATTDYMNQWAMGQNRYSKVATIPNGVNTQEFGKKGEKLDLKLKKPVVLCVSALQEWKRVDLAIKPVAEIGGSLLIAGASAGDKKYEKKLGKLGEKHLGKNFLIKSFKHEDMPKVYRSADLFTYPTAPWEAFGIVMVEAMASGLAVVATDDPIRREIVGDAGVYVDPEDTAEYTRALKKALKRNWTGKPREQAEKFEWDDVAKQYESLLLKITK